MTPDIMHPGVSVDLKVLALLSSPAVGSAARKKTNLVY
jgi:hypothetical protein